MRGSRPDEGRTRQIAAQPFSWELDLSLIVDWAGLAETESRPFNAHATYCPTFTHIQNTGQPHSKVKDVIIGQEYP